MKFIFAEDGPLARAIEGYRPRAGQIAMARAVEERRGRQVLEAGTGIGKTFAYLAPILQNGMSAVISTGTRALQDQLFLRDIPFLVKTLQTPARVAMLKGRGNYLCLRNLANPEQSRLFKGESDDWARVLEFAKNTEEGDIRGAADIPASSPVWEAAVSTRETCPAQGCEHYEKCFLYRARARARAADIVIVNHYLFLADMRLREEDIAELLPARDIAVFDEAHLLPSLAPRYFGESVSDSDLFRITAEIERRAARTALPPGFTALAKQWRAAAGALLELSEHFAPSVPAADALANAEWTNAARRLQTTADELRDAAIDRAGKGDAESREWFAATAARVAAAAQKLQRWLLLAEGGETETDSDSESQNTSGISAPAKSKLGRKSKNKSGAASELESESETQSKTEAESESKPQTESQNESGGEIENGAESETEIADGDGQTIPSACWVEKTPRGGLSLHAAPVSGREMFRRAWENAENVVMTSATLTISGAFDNFLEETGMDGARAESWASPFDYAGRAMLYLPPELPSPNSEGYTAAVIGALCPLIRANAGRAFVLFSSRRALREGAELLAETLDGDCQVLAQGEAPNDALLAKFRKTPRAVLAGSLSFWQGVDVKGGALSLVAADKIPFTPPADPLLAARDTWRKKRGENAFMQNQIPPAAILMKQVAGRLMRDFGDWGVFAACDPRLLSRSYGKIILNSLPPMRRAESEKAACDFLRAMRDGGNAARAFG